MKKRRSFLDRPIYSAGPNRSSVSCSGHQVSQSAQVVGSSVEDKQPPHFGGKVARAQAELRLRMHEPVADVGAWLRKVVNGYYRFHAVPVNIDRLSVFGQRVRRLWWLTLRRRSQRRAAWDRFLPIFTQWLPAPRVLHPYPIVRFLATHPRWEPYAVVPLVRFCAEGDQR